MPPRDDLQGLCSCLDPNRLLLPPTLLVLSPIWTLHRVGSRCHALPLYFGLIFVLSSRVRLAVRDLHLDKDDQSEIHHKSYSKSQIKVRSWGVFLSIPIGLFVLSAFHKLFVQHLPLDNFWDNLSQFDKMLPLLVLGLGIGAIFGSMTYTFLSEHEMKHSESGMHKENIEK